ncbi:MAG: hypothetical protein RL687_208 [Candidatus Parcubacteria bacterium]|jgi:uncharacterized membrane protein
MKKFISSSLVLSLLPVFVFAASVDAESIITKIGRLMNLVIPVLIAFAVVFFIWAVIKYTISGNDEDKEKARTNIIQGLIGLFVIVAFWGIIGIITNTFGVGSTSFTSNNTLPCIPVPNSGITC